jgi:glycosyltransferase involved in cell wall biosynthesis
VRESASDVVALTESREKGWHLQSYFLGLKRSALLNARLQSFFNGVRNLIDKQAVIDRYEVVFAGEAAEAGLKVEALYRVGAQANATLYAWKDLLDEGFPFVKASVLTGRQILASTGFDVALAEDVLRSPESTDQDPIRARRPTPWRPDKIAFYGPWNYSNGLGEASRGYLSAFWRLKVSLNLHGLKTPFHIHRRLAPGYDVRDFVDAADAAIVHLNPDGFHLLTDEQRREIDRARIRIGIWVWEMSHIPEFFRPNFDAVDVIWTPSQYCADVFAAATDRPVHVVPHVVPALPKPEVVPELQRTILYAFDGSSYLARKNPTALLEAFGRSGLSARGWVLVLKTKNLSDNPQEALVLTERCAAEPGVTLIDRPLPREDMAALFRRADIYASPHASEGFGLTIAEAMAAGKLVVATDFGGSRDFLDQTCGFPVACDVITLATDHGHYRKGGQWAQVRIEALAEALLQAAAQLEQGDHTLGERARARIAERLSADTVATAMEASLAELAHLAGRLEEARP